jgi:hypothetical protein
MIPEIAIIAKPVKAAEAPLPERREEQRPISPRDVAQRDVFPTQNIGCAPDECIE